MASLSQWIDRSIGMFAPRLELKRMRARIAAGALRSYDAASVGRRTQGWRRSSADPNAASAPYAGRLRDAARDLVRNNPHAISALTSIVDKTVGLGIVAKAQPANPRAQAVWDAWANSTACDADGRNDFAGLQKLVLRTTAESGEVLIRQRMRRPEDGLPIPMQLQVLEPDYLDTSKHGITGPTGGPVIYGVEFDGIGRRVAYYLFRDHPGNAVTSSAASVRVPADGVLHVFDAERPGQVRGVTWFARVLLAMKDFDDYVDAQLMKQKVAACLAVFVTDPDGTTAPLGTADDTTTPGVDSLEPGGVHNMPAGRSVTVVDPPTVGEYRDFCEVSLRAIAAGLQVPYEDLTGDYTNLPFSAARMSQTKHWSRVHDWQWRLLIPQFCDPAWRWAMDAAAIMGKVDVAPPVRWTAPPRPMLQPETEGLAYQRKIRSGLMTLSEAIRECGYDPDELLAEYAADLKKLDKLGIVLDSDARQMTQAGQLQQDKTDGEEPADQPKKVAPMRVAGGR